MTKEYEAYTFPGGYPLAYLDVHAEVLCATCAQTSVSEGGGPVTSFVHWEGPAITCVECGAEIESAYGDGGDE